MKHSTETRIEAIIFKFCFSSPSLDQLNFVVSYGLNGNLIKTNRKHRFMSAHDRNVNVTMHQRYQLINFRLIDVLQIMVIYRGHWWVLNTAIPQKKIGKHCNFATKSPNY